MRPPTEKQMRLIRDVERMVKVEFKGETIKDATAFITRHMDEYQEEMEFVFDMTYNPYNY